MSLFAELKRRKVIKVAVAYVVGAWLVLQLADVLSELLDLPDVVEGTEEPYVHYLGVPEPPVRDALAALNSTAANLDFPVQNGTFQVKVRDQATGQTITRMIQIDLDGIAKGYAVDAATAATQ